MAPPLRLARSKLPGADGQPPANDYAVKSGTAIVGRIYLTPNRTGDPWFWAVQRFPSYPGDSGHAPDLPEAMARFRRRWDAIHNDT